MMSPTPASSPGGAAYLLGESPARPLQQDAKQLAKAGALGAASAYLDPQEAERLIRRYKRSIQP